MGVWVKPPTFGFHAGLIDDPCKQWLLSKDLYQIYNQYRLAKLSDGISTEQASYQAWLQVSDKDFVTPLTPREKKAQQKLFNIDAQKKRKAKRLEVPEEALAKLKAKPVIDERTMLRWVFENMGTAEVKPEDAPSPGAYSMWLFYRDDPKARQDFYQTIWPKVFTKTESVEDRKMADNGEAISTIDRIMAAAGG